MHLDLIRTSESLKSDDLTPIIAGLNQVIEDIRYYILNLKSRSCIQKTIRQYFDEILRRLHIPTSMKVEADIPDSVPPFTPATFESICLIANEAISNAVRHANANSIRITVRQTEADYRIIITDNGQGFNTDNAAHQQGLGLTNIQQRARFYGGQINISSVPMEGTTVQIIIPI